eukprot:PhF_6_TR35783/c0_g1_i4/m.52004
MSGRNRLSKSVARFDSLPGVFKSTAMSYAFGYFVPFAGTAGVKFVQLNQKQCIVSIPNKRKVQNHIQGVHACGMALVAETATGFVFGMSVPDTHLPLCKHLNVNFVRRSQGMLTAEATLSDEQIKEILSKDKGEVIVPVVVRDESGQEPVKVEACWAWVPKVRPDKPKKE